MYQSQIEPHTGSNVNLYYASYPATATTQMYNTNVGGAAYPSQLPYKSSASRDMQSMVSVSRHQSRTNLMSFTSVDASGDTTVHSYILPHHHSAATAVDSGGTPHYSSTVSSGTPVVLNPRSVQHDVKQHAVIKPQDHHIADVNYGLVCHVFCPCLVLDFIQAYKPHYNCFKSKSNNYHNLVRGSNPI